MAREADALVLGADVEGLAAAATLARAGRRVVLVDGQSAAGGVHAGEEFHPGHFSRGLVHDISCARRDLLAPLELERFGLAWRTDEPELFVPTSVAPADPAASSNPSPGFAFRRDANHLRTLLGSNVRGDPEAWLDWRAFVGRIRGLVLGLLDSPPPEVIAPRLPDLWGLAARALELRRLGREDMLELMRLGPMSAADLAAERFQSEALRVALVAPALVGSFVGPRAPGTALLVLLRECAAGPEPVGGGAALAEALAAAARHHNVELRLGEAPAQLVIEDGRVRGVTLAGGEALRARRVLSALDPRTTFRELVPRRELPPELDEEAGNWRSRGTLGVVRLALTEWPRLAGSGATAPERLLSAPSLLDLERAFDAPKYGVLAERPVLDVFFSGKDASTVASVLVHGVPHRLREGVWDEGARGKLGALVLAGLELLLPGIRSSVRGSSVLGPPDLEARTGRSGGHLLGGEAALDQFWATRPSLSLARYATPLPGLFLCGGSSHPGGAFLGGAGVLGARRALAG